MQKSPDAFRTISEVAEELDLPQHVLRFWETRFPQIKPLKRAGGRRFYRPNDVEFLRGVKHLLYGEGYTIRGVQKILKEQGVRVVASIISDAPDEGAGLNSPDMESAPAVPDEHDLPLFQSTLPSQPFAADTPRGDAPVLNSSAIESLRRILIDLDECEQILTGARQS
ncbi:MerR family transcriptional regulator [Methylocapsa palsarum]|uniref:MerR HTH family regulatory protein n=1 Tax=Methylocapsa palsarum TaxID=1612308 RepID=A0A1I3Y776_9HYPH|nr:MerR family transcriptional regulator [Methylocapsa palsarum]SFK27724.1 MerR HTH family regulatory protein [Methylocapsa palsarum]